MNNYYYENSPFFFNILFILGMILIISLISYIFKAIGMWKLFKKAGKPGWPALIPIYNTYILCEITGVSPWWILITFLATFVSDLIPIIFPIIGMAIQIYFLVILSVSTARSYGKDDSWAVGLVFLKSIFLFILGISKNEYQGARPMKDPILEAMGIGKEQQSTVSENNNINTNHSFCTNCGSPLIENTSFCPNCGKKR